MPPGMAAVPVGCGANIKFEEPPTREAWDRLMRSAGSCLSEDGLQGIVELLHGHRLGDA